MVTFYLKLGFKISAGKSCYLFVCLFVGILNFEDKNKDDKNAKDAVNMYLFTGSNIPRFRRISIRCKAGKCTQASKRLSAGCLETVKDGIGSSRRLGFEVEEQSAERAEESRGFTVTEFCS